MEPMSLLRQIRDLKTEYAAVNAHLLRQVIQLHGCFPLSQDPVKGERRTFLDGWMIVGGLPSTPPYEVPEAEYRTPEQFTDMPEDAICLNTCLAVDAF
jgi:hypothetical protein